jgi:hypothetical protein
VSWRDIEVGVTIGGLRMVIQPDKVWVDIIRNDIDTDAMETYQRIKVDHQAIVAAFRLDALLDYMVVVLGRLESPQQPFNAVSDATLAELLDLERIIPQMLELAQSQELFDLDERVLKLPSYFSRLRQAVEDWVERKKKIELARYYSKARPGFVYLFKLETGHYKIGLSENPERRSKEVVSGLPFSIEILHTIPTNQMECLEYELHDRFKAKRYAKTEWFNLSEADVESIKTITAKDYEWIDNPEWDEIINPPPVTARMPSPPMAQPGQRSAAHPASVPFPAKRPFGLPNPAMQSHHMTNTDD